MAVYHLHVETSQSTICANGKQKYLMISSVRIGQLPFTQQPPVYRERLVRVRPDQYKCTNGVEEVQIVTTFAIRVFRLENSGLPFKTLRLFQNFPVGQAKIVLPFKF